MQIHERAILLPLHRHSGQIGRLLTRYGLQTASGRRINSHPILISLDTSWPYQTRRRPDANDLTQMEGQFIYGGLIFGWFGHFITESLPNLLAVARAKKAHPDARILAHGYGAIDPDLWRLRYARHAQYFMDALGLDLDDLHFVDRPIQVGELVLPPTPFHGKFRYQNWIFENVDRIWGCPDGGGKHYLSRRELAVPPRIVDEDRIEAIFSEHGYASTHLQSHSLDDQIRLIAQSTALAGPQGSALHWSLYGQNCRSVLSLGYRSSLQRGICAARGQTYVEVPGRRMGGGTHRLRQFSDDRIHCAIAALP